MALLEEIRSDDGVAAWFGGIADVVAGQGARVRYASLQRLGDAAWNLGAQRVEVGQDAEVTTLNAEVGSAITKLGVEVRMAGKGGTSRVLGLLAAGGSQHIDINSVQDLIASHTTSDLLYLSALYDQARAAFYGVTRVRHEAKRPAATRSAATCCCRRRRAPSRSRCSRSRPTTSCAAATARPRGPSIRSSASTRSPAACPPRRRSG